MIQIKQAAVAASKERTGFHRATLNFYNEENVCENREIEV
jgi:hypothetical protein